MHHQMPRQFWGQAQRSEMGGYPIPRNLHPQIIEIILPLFVVVVQSLSHVSLFGTPWTTACQVFLSFTISRSLLQLMSIESVMASNHLIPLFSESKLTLLTARQANESQQWGVEAREIPLFGKQSDWEDGK